MRGKQQRQNLPSRTLSQATTVTLAVAIVLALTVVSAQSGQVGTFTISASPASLSIPQGNQGTSTITTTISGGFNSAISLSASGSPPGRR